MRKYVFLLCLVSLLVVPSFAAYPDVQVDNNFPDSVTVSGSGSLSVDASGPGVTVTPVDIVASSPGLISALVDMFGSHVGDVYSVVGCSIFVPSLPWVLAGVLLLVCVWCLFRFGGAVFGRR